MAPKCHNSHVAWMMKSSTFNFRIRFCANSGYKDESQSFWPRGLDFTKPITYLHFPEGRKKSTSVQLLLEILSAFN